MKYLSISTIALGVTLCFGGTAASACTVPVENPVACEYFDPTGQKPNGTLNLPLTEKATVCHPNWQNLNFQDTTKKRWYSYAIFLDGQLANLVAALRDPNIEWTDEVELSPGIRCHERYAAANWNFAVFDPCEVPGYNVLRVAPVTTNGQIFDSFEEWPIVVGVDGKPLLFAL